MWNSVSGHIIIILTSSARNNVYCSAITNMETGRNFEVTSDEF
jgi:hypothetical protein